MKYDGSVTIQTSIEEKGIDKGIENISNKLEKLRKKAEEPYEIDGVKVTGGWNLTDKEQKYYDRLEASLNKLQLQKAEIMMADKQITQEVKEQTEAINQQIPSNDSNKAKIVELSRELEEMLNNYNAMKNQDILSDQDVNDAKELRKEILRVKKEYEKLTGTKLHIKGITDTKKDFNDIGKSLSNTVKKVGRWALAIFSVRSAYAGIRNAMSVLTQYNQDLADKINTIKLTFASALEPIITRIVDLVHGLLVYIDYIANAWFRMNLLASANEKAMNKTNKSTKELKKTMASFDEMNVINDSSSGGASTQTGFVEPKDVPIPSWVQWIADNKDIVIAGLLGIAGGLTAVSFGLTAIQGLGIGVSIAGIVMLIQDIIDMINDPSWENFIAILGDIAIVIGGIMLVMGNWWGLLIVIIGLLVKLVAENWDKVKEILGQVGSWIYDNIVVPVINFFKAMFDTIWSIIKLFFSNIKAIFTTIVNIIANPFIVAKETIIGVFNNIKSATTNIVNGIKKLFSGDLKGALNDFKNSFSNVFGSLWTIAKAPLNLIIGGINSLIKGVNKISFDVPDWVPGIGGQKWGFNIPQIPKLAVGGIVNMPGRGVPVSGAITGKSGREGVIPLTDSQAMETLGATIGKYININLTNITKLDNRQIAKEQKKINAQNDFAFNR